MRDRYCRCGHKELDHGGDYRSCRICPHSSGGLSVSYQCALFVESDYLDKVKALFPVGSMEAGAELAVCNCRNQTEDGLILHLVTWDPPGPTGQEYRHVRDVKEQKIYLPDKAFEAWDFWFALKDVIAEVLVQHPNIGGAMPEDFFRRAWSALDLKSKDYHRALRMKSRLGKFLPREWGDGQEVSA